MTQSELQTVPDGMTEQIDFRSTEVLKEKLPPIIAGFAAGYAGRHYFGGFGGALFGYALYSVFLKPYVFPPKSKKAGL